MTIFQIDFQQKRSASEVERKSCCIVKLIESQERVYVNRTLIDRERKDVTRPRKE